MSKIVRVNVLIMLLLAGGFCIAAEPGGIEPFKLRAEQGDAVAQAKLGASYHLGRGVEISEEQAMHWMLKAAEQNLLDAEVFVAAMYDRGLGVQHDVAAATLWYEKAAAQGQETAQGLLGPYQHMRIRAAAQIPNEYAKKILKQK